MVPTSVLFILASFLGRLALGFQHPLGSIGEALHTPSRQVILGMRGKKGGFFDPTPDFPAAIRVIESASPMTGYWEWIPSRHTSSIPTSVGNCVTQGPSVTEIKWASNGTQISAIVGSAAVVINYAPGTPEDKSIAFATCVSASHTAEVLPDDLFAVATTGKTQRDGFKIYNMANFPIDKLFDRDPSPIQTVVGFPAVHGLLWDETDQKLWAVGNSLAPDGNQPSQPLLRGYPFNTRRKLGGWNPVNDAAVETYNLSSPQRLDVEWSATPYVNWWDGPHDLVGIPNSRLMLTTTDLDVHVFDIEKASWLDNEDVVKRFLQGFRPRGNRVGDGGKELPRSDIKSISVHADGAVLYVQAIWKDWFGDRISILGNNTFQGDISVPSKLYKARWFSELPGWPSAVKGLHHDG